MPSLMKETEFFTLHTLCDGVYAVIAKPGQGAWSNAGIVDLGEELLVFDSLSTPSAAQELRRQAEKITDKKVKYLINSHYHGDHVFGNQEFLDATIIATSLTKKMCSVNNKIEDFEKEEKEMQQYLLDLKHQIKITEDSIRRESLIHQYDEMLKVLEDLREMKIILPTVIFEEKLIIKGSKRSIELHCLGGGHTPSDTFMYLPNEKIAFMGDLVTEKLHLPIYNPVEFISILNFVRTMEINTIIPGHGNVGNMTMLDTLFGYVSLLIQKAKEAHESKWSLEDFKTEFITPCIYRDWKGVNGIEANLSSLYNFYSK